MSVDLLVLLCSLILFSIILHPWCIVKMQLNSCRLSMLNSGSWNSQRNMDCRLPTLSLSPLKCVSIDCLERARYVARYCYNDSLAHFDILLIWSMHLKIDHIVIGKYKRWNLKFSTRMTLKLLLLATMNAVYFQFQIPSPLAICNAVVANAFQCLQEE